jgi:hypothetical protein
MNRENNNAIQPSDKRPDQVVASGTFEITRDRNASGQTEEHEDTLSMLDLLNAELDVENDPENLESQRRLVTLKNKARESASQRAAEQAKVKPEDLEKFSPLLEAINAEVDASADLRAAEAEELDRIMSEFRAKADRERAEAEGRAKAISEMMKVTDAENLEKQKEAILKTLEQMNAEGPSYRPKQKTVREDQAFVLRGGEQAELVQAMSMNELDKLNESIDASQDRKAAKAEQWDAKRRTAIGRAEEAPVKEVPKPPELSPERRAERAAERAKRLAERVDEAMRLNEEARAAWDKTAAELDQAFWSETADDKAAMPILDSINAKLDKEADEANARTLGVIDEIDSALDKTDSVELKLKTAKLRSLMNVPKPPQNIERRVNRAIEEARAAERQREIEAIKAEAAEERKKHLEEAFGTGWTKEELAVFERGEFESANPTDHGFETETDGGEYLVKRRNEEIGRIIAENALTPERKLGIATQIAELEKNGHELTDKYKLEETKLNHMIGDKTIDQVMALEYANDQKSVLSRLAIGFRRLFTKDTLGNQLKAYNEALSACQENDEKIADLKLVIENPQAAADVAAIRLVQRLRRINPTKRTPTMSV